MNSHLPLKSNSLPAVLTRFHAFILEIEAILSCCCQNFRLCLKAARECIDYLVVERNLTENQHLKCMPTAATLANPVLKSRFVARIYAGYLSAERGGVEVEIPI
jgi:hypothetical protein